MFDFDVNNTNSGNNGKKKDPWYKLNLTDEQKKKIAIGAAGVLLIALILLLIFGIRGCGNSQRSNICNLAKAYADKGEYDRALNKLDGYLEKHADDDEVWDLWNQILEMKKASDNGQTPVGFDINIPNSLKVDTSDISDAVKDALAQSNRQAEENRKAAEENRRAMENLVKIQESQAQAEEKRQAEAAAEAAEKKAKEEALAEQKRIQEEKRKAEEAELAKKNAELKKQIDAVNEEIEKGKIALASGNTEEAMKHFKNAEKIIPESAGAIFTASKESEMAQELYQAAERADSPEKKAQLMKEAVAMAQKAIQNNPKDAAAHYIIAQNAINNKDYNTALKELTAAVQNADKDDPNRYLYFYELGKIQYRLKKYSEAASSFNTSCELKNDFAPSRYNLGLTQKQLNNLTAALDSFRKTIDIDARHEKAFLEEARILTARGDYSGAIDAYKSVLRINNINVQAAMELGSAYYQKKNYVDAEDSYRRALTMLSESEEMTLTKYNLSTVLYDAGKVDDAEKYAREAYEAKSFLKKPESKANIIYNYALILDKTGKADKAIPCYMEVLECNPNHTKTKINLGVMYMNLEPPEVDTALNLFTQVYNKESNNFEANNNLGSAYLMKEDYKNAIKFYQNALRIDSKNNAVRANLAKAYAKNEDYNNAKTTYVELLKTDKENWDAYVELAKVCMQLNDNAGAEKYLVYVQEKRPDYRAAEVANLLAAFTGDAH